MSVSYSAKVVIGFRVDGDDFCTVKETKSKPKCPDGHKTPGQGDYCTHCGKRSRRIDESHEITPGYKKLLKHIGGDLEYAQENPTDWWEEIWEQCIVNDDEDIYYGIVLDDIDCNENKIFAHPKEELEKAFKDAKVLRDLLGSKEEIILRTYGGCG